MENIDQVEILKGASSALYGSSALNGVINIRTGYPEIEPSTTVTLYSGIYDKPKREELSWWWETNPLFSGVSFTHSRKIKEVDIVVGANALSDAGYRTNSYDKQIRANVKFRHRPKKIKDFHMESIQISNGNKLLISLYGWMPIREHLFKIHLP